MTKTIQVRITDETRWSWYKGQIGDVFTVEQKNDTHHHSTRSVYTVYTIHPRNGKVIFAKNCVEVSQREQYPTLRIEV